jgi:hypothetical protein
MRHSCSSEISPTTHAACCEFSIRTAMVVEGSRSSSTFTGAMNVAVDCVVAASGTVSRVVRSALVASGCPARSKIVISRNSRNCRT